jgi:hypothetical protein
LLDLRWDPKNFTDERWSVWDGSAIAGSTDFGSTLFSVKYGDPAVEIREDGGETGSGSFENRNFNAISIGGSFNGRYFHGAIGEVRIVDGTLSQTDRDNYESYLADKWGVTL